MRIEELNGKKVCILGFGKEGQATIAALEKFASNAEITIADANPATTHPTLPVQCGPEYLSELDRFDVIIKSPGIPPNAKLKALSSKLTSSTQIFLDTMAGTGATVIGVTGSKGKSTTSTLIYEILKAYSPPADVPYSVHLVGNIGEPAIAHLDQMTRGALFVMEMSSYQLMDLTTSPHFAVITSFFPEHLDYHGSVENYLEAKKHITRFQDKDDIVFFDSSSKGATDIANESTGKKIPFAETDAPVSLNETKLIGAHNLRNIAAAWKVVEHLGVPKETAIKAIKMFHGLPHRLQSLGVHHGIEWIDDAISTTPESTIAALDALGDRVTTIILGGQDRGNDFSDLGKRIASSKIQNVILFPGSGPRIKEAIQNASTKLSFFDASTMEEAVASAKKHTQPPTPNSQLPIVLLSTASPSYGMFKNFEEKGEQFRRNIGA